MAAVAQAAGVPHHAVILVMARNEMVSGPRSYGSVSMPVRIAPTQAAVQRALAGAPPPRIPEQPVTLTSLPDALVLVAEDNRANQETIGRMLRRLGLRYDTVANGLEAVEALQLVPYDAVFMDLIMPVMDGPEAARRIRAGGGRNASIPILGVTGSQDPALVDRARAAGIPECLTKPLQLGQLREALVRTLTGKSVAALEVPEPPQPPPPPPEPPRVVRVLVAEDNLVNQMVIRRMLGRIDASCEVVENGALAVEAAARSAFDIILMDVQMPKMDGLEATRKIRATGSTIPIVGVSANVLDEDRRAGIAAGMDEYLNKPVRPEQLFETIARLTVPSRTVSRPVAFPAPVASATPAPPPVPQASQRPVTPPPPPQRASDPSDLRVLAAEDNPINQMVIKRMLADLGATVIIAENGVKAVELHAREPFDVVLMDIQMPEMDGIEATRRIRASEPRGTRIPIIAVTANPELRAECMESGMDEVVAKPPRREQIAAILARYVPVTA